MRVYLRIKNKKLNNEKCNRHDDKRATFTLLTIEKCTLLMNNFLLYRNSNYPPPYNT